MKTAFTVLALAAALCTAPAAFANAHKEAPNMQQDKMTACNKEAGDKKGDERQAFMKECLAAPKQTQQDKMKTCNAEAKGKKGDEHKAFMKECLSSKT